MSHYWQHVYFETITADSNEYQEADKGQFESDKEYLQIRRQEMSEQCSFCDGGRIQIFTQHTEDWLDTNDWQTIQSLREYEHLRSAEDFTNIFRAIEIAINGSGEISCPACK